MLPTATRKDFHSLPRELLFHLDGTLLCKRLLGTHSVEALGCTGRSGLEGGRYRTGRSRLRDKAYRLSTAPLTRLQLGTPVSLTDPQTTVPPQPALKWPSFRVTRLLRTKFPSRSSPSSLSHLSNHAFPHLGSQDTLHSLATLGRLLSRSGFDPEISWLAVFI